MKNWILGALLTLGFFTSSMAWAQGCAGVDVGGSYCVPPPGAPDSPLGGGGNSAGGGGNSAPHEVWSDRYGAIANDATGKSGESANQSSQAQANEIALDKCKQKGGVDCKITLPYRDTCIAIAHGTTSGSGMDSGSTLKAAEADALIACSNNTHGQQCSIFYSACSLPVRIQ